MKFHRKAGHMLHKHGHHHLKRKLRHFKGGERFMRSTFEDGEHPCEWKFFDGSPKRSKMAGGHRGIFKRKHFQGMRGHSSSDSDDDDHHHHHKRGRGMHGSDGRGSPFWVMHSHGMSDVEAGHHGRGSPFRGTGERCMSEGPSGPRKQGTEERCMSEGPCDPRDKRMEGRCMSEGPHGSRKHCMRMEGKGRCVSESPCGPRNNFRRMERRGMSEGPCGPGKHFRGMSEGPRNNFRRMEERGMSEGPCGPRKLFRGMYEGHHGLRKHFRRMERRSMSDSDDDQHGRGRHMRGMMHHHRGKHMMKRHGKRGFFDDDSALIPICTMEGNNCTETRANANAGDEPNVNEGLVADDGATTKEQGTQTTGIMEIVIEDQEALSAAIRIANKFL